MDKNYPILIKLGVALIFSCLALFLPFFAAKIVFAGVAGILFALCFKRFKVLMIIFFVIVMLVMSTTYFVHDFLNGVNIPWFMQQDWIKHGNRFSINLGNALQYVNPDTMIEPKSNLTIKGDAVKINFTNDTHSISYPSEIVYSIDDDRGGILLDARNLRDDSVYVIDIPEDYTFSNLKVYASGGTIAGDVSVEKAEYHVFALEVRGDYDVEHLFVDTNAMEWNGRLNGGEFIFKTDASDFSADIEDMRLFEITSNGILNGNIAFKKPWSGERIVNLRAPIGKFDIRKPKDNQSVLRVNSTGDMFKVNISEYHYSEKE